MADTKTSDETSATALDGTELVRLVQGASSKKTTAALLGHQFRGCRVRLTADDAAQNVTSETAISFDQADFDTDTFWSAGTPTRVTIPAGLGIAYVELTGQAYVTSSTADTVFSVTIYHYNSAGTPQHIFSSNRIEYGTTTKSTPVSTGPIDVADGDYFSLIIREESDTSVTIEGDNTLQTYLALKVVGMEPV